MSKFYLCLKKAEHDICSWTLMSSIFLFLLLRLPSLIEPDWYGDEGIYQVVGQALNQGKLLYKGIFDNKPPFLYLIYQVFNGDLFWIKFSSLIAGIFSIVAIFFLAKKNFKNHLAIFVTTLIFSLFFGLPILEGNIANAENFMLAPIIFSGLFLFMAGDKKIKSSFIFYLLSGLLLSIAFLLKIVAIFDFLAFLSFLLIEKFNDYVSIKSVKNYLISLKSIRKIINGFNKEIIFTIFFFVPILATFLYFLFKGTFFYFLQAVFSQNIGYVGWGNYFLFPMGFLLFKLLLLAFILFLIIKNRHNLKLSGVFVFVWFSFSVFNLFFSERPYTHYILVLLPAFSCLVGLIAESSKKIANISFAIILLVLILISKTFWFGKNPLNYYSNYLEFTSGRKSIISYQNFFNKNTSRDYEVARFINAHAEKDEQIFIWGDSAQIYYLAGKLPPGRFSVAYHITSNKSTTSETLKSLILKKPRFIIVLDNVAPFLQNYLSSYILKFNLIDNVKIYER